MHEQIEIPGTRATLDYYSQQAAANSLPSTFSARLTGHFIPRNLKLVHAVVSLAGRRFHNVLEPEPLLNYTFSWDKLNAYGQPVYGDEEAVGEDSLVHICGGEQSICIMNLLFKGGSLCSFDKEIYL